KWVTLEVDEHDHGKSDGSATDQPLSDRQWEIPRHQAPSSLAVHHRFPCIGRSHSHGYAPLAAPSIKVCSIRPAPISAPAVTRAEQAKMSVTRDSQGRHDAKGLETLSIVEPLRRNHHIVASGCPLPIDGALDFFTNHGQDPSVSPALLFVDIDDQLDRLNLTGDMVPAF